MTRLIETLISGLSLGSIYALMALGYTMVYGIAKMLNFAHGDIIMVGAYAVVTSVLTLGMPPLVAILISIAVCALLGITVEFLAYRPLRQAPPLAVLITAIGVSYLLQNLALLIYGSEQKAFPVLFTIPSVELGGVYIDGITIATMAVTAIIMVGLSLFINRTRMGKAMRAVSEDKEAAELMGISVNRTITVTFAIGSGGRGRHLLRSGLHLHPAHHRRHARHQGLYRSRVWRHRVYSRRYAGRCAAGRYRAALQDVYFHPVGRRHRVRRAGGGAGGEAHRPAGQAYQ